MGETRPTRRMSHVAGRRAAGGMPTRPGLNRPSGTATVLLALAAGVIGVAFVAGFDAVEPAIYDFLAGLADTFG